MKYKSAFLLPMLVLAISGCDKSGAAPQKSAETAPVAGNNVAGPTEAAKTPEVDTHLMQITVLNFLRGGLEQCDVKNKIFSFTAQDKNLKESICKNSKIEVFSESDSGTVEFHAIDLTTGAYLPNSDGLKSPTFELGRTQAMLRYSPANPYGFTYVMAEEVTGIDPQVLAQWNELNGKLASLRAQVLTAQQNGQGVPKSVIDEMKAIEAKMAELAAEMEKSRQN